MGSASEPLYWRLQILNGHKCLSDKSWKRRRYFIRFPLTWVVVLGSVTNAGDLMNNFNIQAPAPFRIHNELVKTKYVLAGSFYLSLVLEPGSVCTDWQAWEFGCPVWAPLHYTDSALILTYCVSILTYTETPPSSPHKPVASLVTFTSLILKHANFFIPQFLKSMIMYYLTTQKRWEKFSCEFLS